jgi:hypothetical protein
LTTATGRLLGSCAAGVLLLGFAAGLVRADTHTAAVRPKRPPYRYLIDAGPNVKLEASLGWNLLDVGSKEEADALPRGTRGLVWVGDYDNSTCDWQVTDAQLEQELAHTAGDAKIAGFFFSDEPDPYACPDAPAQHRARSRLIHSLDPHGFTVMLMDSNSGKQTLEQMQLWAGAADRIALDPYPCYRGRPCNYGWIRSVIRAANRAQLPYWGVVQAFAGEDWRWPTPAEEKRMLALWATSREKGYMTFAWTWHGNSLAKRPGLLSVLKRFNHGVLFRAKR